MTQLGFFSEEHKELFEKSPTTYSPQYGGWSLTQMAGAGGEGFGAQTRPEDSWVIFKNKLYLIDRVDWAEYFSKNKEAMTNLIKYADSQWPRVRKDIKSGAKTFWPSLKSKDPYDSHEMRPVLADTEIMVLRNGYVIGGYDPVAYFKLEKATKGKKNTSYKWNGATWLFASEEHRDLFEANPEKYAPQYGGWCAYGMSGHGSNGYGAESRPQDSWSITDGKLYLNWSSGVKNMFLKKEDEYIKSADVEWQKIRKELLKVRKVHWRFF
ncbi:YHS domain-containing (seleno)protein [Flavobacteriaceae bacterium 3-367]|uniref:YHS domain-containing (seleno)protein n=1 Tax=Eudoraea algarum TaxID=3417568 RepID=UPI00327FE056